MTTLLISSVVSLLLTAAPSTPTLEERGDQAWRERATLETETVRRAVAAYEEALEADPENLGLLFKLMEALYFEGYFVIDDESAQKKIYEREVKLARRALDLVDRRAGKGADLGSLAPKERIELLRQVPGAVDAHFWAAVSWGLWGMSHNRAIAGIKFRMLLSMPLRRAHHMT